MFHNSDSVDLLAVVLRLDLKEKSWNAFSTLKGCCKPLSREGTHRREWHLSF